MFRRLKQALVDSYVGALGLGWLLAGGISHFTGIFTVPFARWMTARQFRGLSGAPALAAGFPWTDALPEAASSLSALLVCYLLLRWLYFTPIKRENVITEQSR